MGMDLITLEVLRNKFDVIADEMEIALLKSAYSSIVKGRNGRGGGAFYHRW
jgi:N-methylhydantoinase B/oxoprolinase/acetone carboxylase alpha subunit